MGKVLEMAERLWSGEASTADLNPLMTMLGFEELPGGVGFISGFANVTAFATEEGLVCIDTGSPLTGPQVRAQLRAWRPDAVHTAVYTHGHVDHACGVLHFDDPGLRVVAHRAVPPRFERYLRSAGYNGHVNARQFRMPGLQWPTDYRHPDQTYEDRLTLDVGGVRLELRHAHGETDDHTWVWAPEARVLCTGDLFIWAAPNCGNPQKAQRYPREWAAALREMAALEAEVLCPGHGVPIIGRDRVRQALGETALLLETVHDEALRLMNDGATLDDLLHTVKAPPELLERPYLRPVYDDPEFVVRNVWRLYGGWYDGNPAHLQPPPDAALAAEVCVLAGGPDALARRALEVAESGDLRLAGQLAEWAFRVDPKGTGEAYARVNRLRFDGEPSMMAKSIYLEAAERATRPGRG